VGVGARIYPQERARNSFGDPIEFVYDDLAPEEHIPSVNPSIGLPDLPRCRTVSHDDTP